METDAGHGAGSPISKLIDEQVDILSFLTESLDLEFEGQRGHSSGGIDIRCSVSTMLVMVLLVFCSSRH